MDRIDTLDDVEAWVLSKLTAGARARLDRTLRERRALTPEFRTAPADLPDVQGVLQLRMTFRSGSPRFSIVFGSGKAAVATWSAGRLKLTRDLPNTIAAALAGKPMTHLIDHPAMADVVISSVGRMDGEVVVHPKIRPRHAVADIVSTGVERPIDAVEALRGLGVSRMCPVAEIVLTSMNEESAGACVARAADGRSRYSDVIDLIHWRPRGVSALYAKITGDQLHITPAMEAASYQDGVLRIYAERARTRLMGGVLFGQFSKVRGSYDDYTRWGKALVLRQWLTLDEVEATLHGQRMARAT